MSAREQDLVTRNLLPGSAVWYGIKGLSFHYAPAARQLRSRSKGLKVIIPGLGKSPDSIRALVQPEIISGVFHRSVPLPLCLLHPFLSF